MNVLLTGGAGYLGSIVARGLLSHGHRVRVLDCLMYGGAPLLELYCQNGFQFTRGDVRSADVVRVALEDIEAVVHLAAIVGDPACARQAALAREVNVDASLQLYDLCRRKGVKRFAFASTCSNYGKMANSSEYLCEESDLRPVSLYAETKVAVERALLDTSFRGGGPLTTILRFATLFGLSPRMRFDLTVNEFTMEMWTKRKLVVYGEHFWRPYVHVYDAARAILKVLEVPRGQVESEVFNVGSTSQNYQKKQIAELIRGHIDGSVAIDYVHKEEDPRDYRVSFSKIERHLDFHTIRNVENGVREIIDAIRQGVVTDLENPSYRNI